MMSKSRAAQRQRQPPRHSHSLTKLILDNRYRIVAEVGVFYCTNAIKILSRCADQLDTYHLIDQWKPYGAGPPDREDSTGCTPGVDWEGAYQNALRLGALHPRLRVWRLPSLEAAKLFQPESLDLVFIDSNHSYQAVKDDVAAWSPVVRPGGILAGHDYSRHYPGVVRAVDELVEGDVRFMPDTVWCTRKQ